MPWSISGGDGRATIDPSSGYAVFPKNTTSSDIKYKVTYTDTNGCSCDDEVTVAGVGVPTCTCASSNFKLGTISGVGTAADNRLPSSGGKLTIPYTADCGTVVFDEGFNVDSSWVKVNTSPKTIEITVPNYTGTNDRSFDAQFILNGVAETDCTAQTQTFYQEKGGGSCNPNAYFSDIVCEGGEQVYTAYTQTTCPTSLELVYDMKDSNGKTVRKSMGVGTTLVSTRQVLVDQLASGKVMIHWFLRSDESTSGDCEVNCSGPCDSKCDVKVVVMGNPQNVKINFGSEVKDVRIPSGSDSVTVKAELPETLKVTADDGYIIETWENGYSNNFETCAANTVTLSCYKVSYITVRPIATYNAIGISAYCDKNVTQDFSFSAVIRHRCDPALGWTSGLYVDGRIPIGSRTYESKTGDMVIINPGCTTREPYMQIVSFEFAGNGTDKYYVGGSYECYILKAESGWEASGW